MGMSIRRDKNLQAGTLTKRKDAGSYAALMLMLLPGVLYLLINNYLPMLGIVIAFKDVNFSKGLLGGDWVGFKNFEYLFKTSDAFLITRNTLLYNAAFILVNNIVAISIAVLLNEVRNRTLSRFYQSAVLLPYLISMVIVGYLAFSMLSIENGFLNKTVLPLLGLEPVAWYGEARYWPFILIIINAWKNAGYLSVIYFAAIIGIDREMYEAAEIDGAGRWRQVFKITIPMLSQVIIVMILLQIGRIFYADFGLFYQVPMDAGAIQSATNVIDTYVYRSFMNLGDIGMSSAAGLYQAVVGFVLVILSNYAVRRVDPDSALF
jgi:putative aldouronate transport system permease protein